MQILLNYLILANTQAVLKFNIFYIFFFQVGEIKRKILANRKQKHRSIKLQGPHVALDALKDVRKWCVVIIFSITAMLQM